MEIYAWKNSLGQEVTIIFTLKICRQVPAINVGTRGHCYKLFKQHTGSFQNQNSFSNRVINEWNKLPNHVVEAKSVNNFKNLLDEHWVDRKFDTPFTD